MGKKAIFITIFSEPVCSHLVCLQHFLFPQDDQRNFSFCSKARCLRAKNSSPRSSTYTQHKRRDEENPLFTKDYKLLTSIGTRHHLSLLSVLLCIHLHQRQRVNYPPTARKIDFICYHYHLSYQLSIHRQIITNQIQNIGSNEECNNCKLHVLQVWTLVFKDLQHEP